MEMGLAEKRRERRREGKGSPYRSSWVILQGKNHGTQQQT
jgi:hypothetical protein